MNVSFLTIGLLFLLTCFEAFGSIPLILRVLLVRHSFIYSEQINLFLLCFQKRMFESFQRTSLNTTISYGKLKSNCYISKSYIIQLGVCIPVATGKVSPSAVSKASTEQGTFDSSLGYLLCSKLNFRTHYCKYNLTGCIFSLDCN